MRDVVNRLHANVCYLIMDDLREEELYTQAPVKVSFPEEEDHLDFSLTVRILNRKQVRLSDFSTDATSITLTANLGDTIQSPVGKIVVSPTLLYRQVVQHTDYDTPAEYGHNGQPIQKQPEHQPS